MKNEGSLEYGWRDWGHREQAVSWPVSLCTLEAKVIEFGFDGAGDTGQG